MFACIHIPNTSVAAVDTLLECAGAFSPRVEKTDGATVVFDVNGLERLFGGYSEIAEKIHEKMRAYPIQARVALAANPDAAVCAARGFDGVTVIPRGAEPARLGDLPLAILAPSIEMAETLARWGVRTLREFAKLPAIDISARLGQEGVKLHKLAQGAADRPITSHAEPARFVEVQELDYEITAIEPLTFILSRMLDGICRRLRSLNLATHEVRLALGRNIRVLNLPLAVRNARLLTKLLILDLEAHPPGAAVSRIEVEAFPVQPRIVQNGLFVPLSPEPEKLELTLARLKAVVGEENVGTPEILDTHRPDAIRMRKFVVRDTIVVPSSRGGDYASFSLRLFRPPLEATVQLRNQLPTWIAFRGAHGPIAVAAGPWRTSGDWWRPTMWDREEWDIETADALYRIYFDVHLDRWFAEGVYD
jgi:protein ImuB